MAGPIDEMARATVGHERAKNTVVLGLLSGWFGLPGEAILSGCRRRFAKKSDEVREGNERAFAAGVQYARRASAQEAADAGAFPRRTPREAHRRRQRHVRRGRDRRRLLVLRRLSHHTVHRDHAVPQQGAVQVRRDGPAGGR
jgi:hypothetical protein